jgi:mono/diheme cytochrome c family protein
MQMRKSLLAVCLGSWVAACHGDPNETILQYMPDMVDSPAVKAQKNYIDPPPGAVPMNAMLLPATNSETEQAVSNPVASDEASLKRGEVLWHTVCVACHGTDGKGQNKLGPNFPQPPDLTIAAYRDRKDGFFFHVITKGSAIMPAYGYALDPTERWHIINFLRELQKAGS